MSIFALGDTHLSFGTDKPMDIFGGWNDYVSRIEKNWKAVVGEDDTVIIPGDISWAMSLEGAKDDFSFIHALPGKKIIMKGNHDYWWTTKRKMDNFLVDNGFTSMEILHNNAFKVGDFVIVGSRGWFYDAQTGADKKVILREADRLRRSIECGLQLEGEIIAFLHYPPYMASQKCEEIFSVLEEYNIKRCYFGHLHGEIARNYVSECVDSVNLDLVSADFLGFCPKLIEKI